ncbi:hypothetical protein HAX54_002307 [Datura stramonium]|uniref:glutathione transferase n=1 Tax=Datura stramonium TaxID=4076 RepID=A0ABS8T4B9_DATST|nr:hypothetical protein [Datura stramonium]
MGDVKLIGIWVSPFSTRIEIALKLKGIEYELIEQNPFDKSPTLVKYNPIHKKVPVLLHNGKAIVESLVILEYIDETWKEGTPLLPKDPYQRAVARFWAKFIDEKCFPEIQKLCFGSKQEKEKARDELPKLLKILDNEVKDKKFFGGDTVGFVDIVSIPITYWRGAMQEAANVEVLTNDEFPNISAWAEELQTCSIIKENLPPREKLVGAFRALF